VAILAEHLDEDAGHPYDLGGPCTSGQGDSSDLYQAHTAALIDSNWPRVVELDRQILRNKCADNGRWATLADHLLYLGKLGEVMQILTELHRRGFEFGAPRQKYKRALKGFLSSAAFKLTRLGKALEEEAASGSRQKRELLKKLLAEEKSPVPPDPFVSKDSCPHECCQFGEWTAKKDVTLFDAAKGSRPVGAVRAGEKIEALEGDAYIRPVAAVVVRDYEKFRKDDLLFILDSFGEGQVSYWYHGHVGAKTISTAELKCVSDQDGCWAEYLDDGHSEWWVKMQLSDGGVGWTAQTDEDVFSGQRSQECGGE
jgi:hypothetical protein